MKEREARIIASELASKIGLPVRSGTVFVMASDDGYRLLVSADDRWLAEHKDLPRQFKGLAIDVGDRIVGYAHRRSKVHA